jgi:hypothetical protein
VCWWPPPLNDDAMCLLFHWTRPANLPSIRARGLLPSPKTEPIVLHRPVVWLTAQAALNPVGARSGFIFVVRLTVELCDSDDRLVHWRTWLTEMHNAIMCDDFPPPSREHWWCYFGAVAPWKIISADMRKLEGCTT